MFGLIASRYPARYSFFLWHAAGGSTRVATVEDNGEINVFVQKLTHEISNLNVAQIPRRRRANVGWHKCLVIAIPLHLLKNCRGSPPVPRIVDINLIACLSAITQLAHG